MKCKKHALSSHFQAYAASTLLCNLGTVTVTFALDLLEFVTCSLEMNIHKCVAELIENKVDCGLTVLLELGLARAWQ